MDNIVEPDNSFDFSKLSLAHPVSIAGNAYFTKILFENKPLYIQTPKSSTKQGFFQAPGKKILCDLMFENLEGNFLHWLENLETKCQELIYEKSNEWFQNSLEMSDIESAFNSPMKSFKSGKYYLVRTSVKINSLTNTPLIKIYNENETTLSLEDITSESSVISILEVQGIKFTTRNFQIEIEHKQVMLLNKDIIFENCLIKKKFESSPQLQTESIPSLEPSVETLVLEETVGPSENEVQDVTLTIHDKPISDNSMEDIDSLDENRNTDEIYNIASETNDSSSLEVELHLNKNNNEATTLEEVVPLVESSVSIKSLDLPTEDLEEVNFGLDLENNLETITLKKPNEVYYEMYKQAREKAKNAKKEALLAFLEAKNIKQTYMLEDIDSSDESTFSDDEEEFEKENFY